MEMSWLKRFCLFLALLAGAWANLPAEALARSAGEARCLAAGCCCQEGCSCSGHQAPESDCAMSCHDTRVPVSLQPTVAPPAPEWALLFTVEAVFLERKPVPLQLSQLSMAAGWILPQSPPLGLHVLNLPPPAAHLS